MFQLDSIYGVSPDKDLQRSSGWPLNMHHLSARMKTQIPNNILFGFGPQGIVAFIADQQISRKRIIAQQILWQGFNLGSSSSLDSSENSQQTCSWLIWFGLVYLMQWLLVNYCYSQTFVTFSLQLGKLQHMSAGEDQQPVILCIIIILLYSNINHSSSPLLLLHIAYNFRVGKVTDLF